MLQFYLLPNEVQTYQKSRSLDHWSQSFSLDLVHGQIRVLNGAYIEEIHYNPVAQRPKSPYKQIQAKTRPFMDEKS